MSPQLRCTACGGVYPAQQRDGVPYAHACPPVVELRDAHGQALDAATAFAQAERGAPIARVDLERPGARDENAPAPAALAALLEGVPDQDASDPHRTRNALRDAAIVSQGAGVTPVDDEPDKGRV